MKELCKNYIKIRVVLLFFFTIIFSQEILAIDYNVTVSFYVQDEHGPKINSVVIQPNNISMGNIVSVTVNATDTNKVNNVTVLIHNSSNNLSTIPLVNQSTDTWNSTWNSSNASKGIYYITILAYDNLSNKKEFDHGGIIGINISGLKTYSNTSFELTENNITTINAYTQTNTYLGIISKVDIGQSSVIIAYSEEDLFNKTVSGKYSLGKYIDILVSDSVNNNLGQANIQFYYQESDYSSLGLDETSLQLYFWNTTTSEWTVCGSTGVDTATNFVWANVTHLSTFTIFGAMPSVSISQPSSRGGGGFFRKIKEVIEETIKKEDKQEKEKKAPEVIDEEKPKSSELTAKPGSKEEPTEEEAQHVVPLQTNLAQIIIILLLLSAITFHFLKSSKKTKKIKKLKIKTRKLPSKYHLYLENGIVIKNLEDLLTILREMDKTIFVHHVNNKKNDFAYWVKDVLGNPDLADKLFKAKTKRKMIKILENEFK